MLRKCVARFLHFPNNWPASVIRTAGAESSPLQYPGSKILTLWATKPSLRSLLLVLDLTFPSWEHWSPPACLTSTFISIACSQDIFSRHLHGGPDFQPVIGYFDVFCAPDSKVERHLYTESKDTLLNLEHRDRFSQEFSRRHSRARRPEIVPPVKCQQPLIHQWQGQFLICWAKVSAPAFLFSSHKASCEFRLHECGS